MTENPAFTRRWAELMIRVLARGNRIKIIHTISRDLDEMLSAINQWIPLYMSGSIEPYFYPKKRDGIFKRTLFIAPETAAVISNSVGDQISSAANVLYRDHDAVASFAEEVLHYLHLCRPLMRIFTAREREGCYATLTEFERGQADVLIKTESLSLLTMPENLLASIVERSGIDASNHHSAHAARRKRFLESVKSNQFTELIHLPDMETAKSGGITVSMSDMLDGGAVFYTREDLGVIVAKASQPPVVLAISESNMTAAFWDFLKRQTDEKAYTAPEKAKVIAKLHSYLIELKSHINE